MRVEKAMPSDWLQKQTHSKKKTRWIIVVVLILLLAVAGGTAAGVLLSKKKGGSTASASASTSTTGGGGGLTESEDIKKNGDLNKDSPEIKALLDNPNLHKVFHGIDYTPMNSQYPACKSPPSHPITRTNPPHPRPHQPPDPKQRNPRYRRNVPPNRQAPSLRHGLQPNRTSPKRHHRSRHPDEDLARSLARLQHNNQHPPTHQTLRPPLHLPLRPLRRRRSRKRGPLP